MIPLEKQVCNLELSKKLKELGVKQESLFWWTDVRGRQPDFDYGDRVIHGQSPHPLDKILCSAFTVSELGEMLPDLYSSWHWCPTEYICASNTMLAQHYAWREEDASKVIEFKALTEADARAKMLISLIEQGSVKAG